MVTATWLTHKQFLTFAAGSWQGREGHFHFMGVVLELSQGHTDKQKLSSSGIGVPLYWALGDASSDSWFGTSLLHTVSAE